MGENKDAGLLTTQQSVPVVDTPPKISLPIKLNGLAIKEKEAPIPKEKKQWNTKNLGQRIAIDAMSAGSAGGLVAPIICMIDK